jgi:hypothetical protein
MSNEEIVKALRCGEREDGPGCPDKTCTFCELEENYVTCRANLDKDVLYDSAADRIEDLQSQLTESQRRERAAAEDLRLAASDQSGLGICLMCTWEPEDLAGGPHCGKCAGKLSI